MDAMTVINFWFRDIDSSFWWKKDPAFDALIRDSFDSVYHQAAAGECWHWRSEPLGRLAEIILLDQFPRNMYRDTPKAFAADAMALVLAQEAIDAKADHALDNVEKTFLYMPFMHSESPAIHERAVGLFASTGLESSLDYEYRHKAIIDRFGRYPHRNAILGRPSTDEERAFLAQPDSSF